MSWRYWLLTGIVLAPTAVGQVTVVGRTPVYLPVDKNAGATAILTLQNTSQTPADLDLSLTDFTHGDPSKGGYALHTAPLPIVGVSDADKTTLKNEKLAAGGRLTIQLAVNQLWEFGESTGYLMNAQTQLAELRALRIPAAYNVQLSEAAPEALLAPDSRPNLTIVNNDAMTYRFKWSIVAQGQQFSDPKQPELVLPANSSVQLDISNAAPPASLLARGSFFEPFFSFIADGTLKDNVLKASLMLQPSIASEEGVPPQPAKALAFKLRSHFWSAFLQEVIEAFWTMLLLMAGGLASVWFRYFIPNALGALKLRRQLQDMATKVSGIGDSLPSKWRVFLAGSIANCRAGLSEIPWAFPAFAEILGELQTEAAMYSEWVDIAYAAGIVWAGAQNLLQDGRMPPTALEFLRQKGDDALQPIETGRTSPEELQGMNAALKSAQDMLKAITASAQLPDLEAAIRSRDTRVQAQLPALRTAFPEFPGLWDQLAAATEAPKPAEYTDRDLFSSKADLLRQYRDLAFRRGAPALPFPAAAAAAAAGAGGAGAAAAAPPAISPALTRLKAGDQIFRDYVAPDSVQSLRRATLFLTEMRQDFYEAALLDELAKPESGLQIVADAPSFKPGAPVHFTLRFLRADLNETAACEEWTCHWSFGDGSLAETGWDIYHQYLEPGKVDVTVTLVDLHGNRLQTAGPITREFTVDDPNGDKPARWRKYRWTAEAKVEASQLAFVLAIALVGVFAAARGKVDTLTVPSAVAAIVALGFGADTLKNLITQKSAEK